jgi:hypothetical protein
MASIISAGTTSGTALNMAGDTSGVLQLATNGSTTAVTVDASQNVGIGTTSPTNFGSNFKMLAVQGSDFGVIQGISSSGSTTVEMMGASGIGNIGTRTNHPLALRTFDTERMRIDTNGQILVGASSLPFSNSQFSDGTLYTNNNIFVNNTSGTANYNIRLDGFGDQVYFVWANGNTQNNTISYAYGGTAWVNSSDETLKDIIEPITNAVDKVSQLRSVIGKFKTEEEGTRHPFLIAQDVQKVLPEAVYVNKSRVEGEPDTLGIGYTDTIPLLVAAIKEQQTIINDLKARITALEGAA